MVTHGAHAEEVKLQHGQLTLNANLDKAENWPAVPTVLITHGTLSHNGNELITALQGLLLENGVSSLAINLSLGLNDRHGPYDCATPHTHKHEDAVDEIGACYAPDPRKDTPYLLPKIKKPVLVFAGTEDQAVKGLDVQLAPLAEAGEIELEVMEGADHFFRDLYIEDLVDRAVEFMNE